ncbi:hypothetical protein JHK82_031069 [Glycine max]|nr:hypothetical protein JHK82_031069 [Glycine max]
MTCLNFLAVTNDGKMCGQIDQTVSNNFWRFKSPRNRFSLLQQTQYQIDMAMGRVG